MSSCTPGAAQTFQKVVVSFCPAVSVVGGEDSDGLFVCLEGGVPDLLQLNKELVGGKGTSVTVVNVQLEELKKRADKDIINDRNLPAGTGSSHAKEVRADLRMQLVSRCLKDVQNLETRVQIPLQVINTAQVFRNHGNEGQNS